MATKTVARSVDLEPIDRLEDKLRRLVSLVDAMKAEQTRAAEENQRLTREVQTLHERVAAHDAIGAELSSLKEERDVIRSRVTEMLEQLEALNL
jgi:FtsZ-binding cell division protein ZapB